MTVRSDSWNGTDISASWTRSNAGSATAVVSGGNLTLTKTVSGSDVARVIAATSDTWGASERVTLRFASAPTVISGFALRSTDTFSCFIGYDPVTGNTRAMSYNNGTNRLGGNLGVATGYHADIAMELNGANVLFRTSDDSGATWTTFWTQSIATFVTVSPATVVLIAEDWFNTATAGSEVVAEFNPSSGAPTPTISAITPISGPIGTEITITGTNLSGATGATIGGSIALIGVVVDSATQVRGTTQSGSPASGTIQVTTPGGTAIGPTFTITPIFTDLVVTNPNSIYVVGVLLSAITVRARDQFGNTYLGALAVCTVSSLSLPLTVVGTLTAAFVSGVATFSNLTPSAGAAPPTITSFTPGFGMVGSSVLITGTNLLGVTSVTLGTLPCAFTVGSDTQITAVVPVGAT